MTPPLTPTVGRGLGIARWDKPPRVVATKPCEACDGRGFVVQDQWVQIGTHRANFGSIHECWTCDATGRIVTAVYTRGISLTPICERRP